MSERSMTVAELIERLKKCDPTKTVFDSEGAYIDCLDGVTEQIDGVYLG